MLARSWASVGTVAGMPPRVGSTGRAPTPDCRMVSRTRASICLSVAMSAVTDNGEIENVSGITIAYLRCVLVNYPSGTRFVYESSVELVLKQLTKQRRDIH